MSRGDYFPRLIIGRGDYVKAMAKSEDAIRRPAARGLLRISTEFGFQAVHGAILSTRPVVW